MSDNKINFGITKDTKEKNVAPILVPSAIQGNPMFPSGWKFPVCNLVAVQSVPNKELKDGGTVAVLQFIFRDKDKRQYTHIEWTIDGSDPKFEDKMEWMKSRIKHIYSTVFGSFPDETGIGGEATSFTEFFNIVAEAFNSITTGEGEDAKKVYPSVDMFIKLTYYKKRLGFPLAPNFLEKVINGQPCKLLTVDLGRDVLEPSKTSASSSIPGMSALGGDGGDDLPAFQNGYS